MGNLGQYSSDNLLGVFKGTNYPAAPATLYIALYTTSPTASGAGTEVGAGLGYARLAITTSTFWSAITGTPPSTPRSISNAADVTFGTATAAWGKLIGWALQSAASAGNRWAFNDFVPASQVDVPAGKFVRIKSGLFVLNVP